MPKNSEPYTEEEIALAQELFAKHRADGTLKHSAGLISSITLSDQVHRSACRTVTWRDYLPEARRSLSPTKR